MEFLREQISTEGGEAHPLDGALRYDLGEGLEILIENMPDHLDGLDWSQLQAIVAGLWEYIVTGMRYRTVTFDILDIEGDAQIGWGHIVHWEIDSISKRTAKRGLQLSSPALPSPANSFSGQRNSSLSTPLGMPIDWKVKDTDMTLRFTAFNRQRGVRDALDPAMVRDLLARVIEIIQKEIATHGDQASVNRDSFRYGHQIILEVINWVDVLTWGQLGLAVVGLVEYMVDHNHYRSWYFSIYVQDPMVEIGIGKIANGPFQHDNNNATAHDNVTVARRIFVDGDGDGAG